ncbi:MAG TPA: hypothetical protein VJ926_02225 [Patescibacteria group bacterium]|nr:hypothetical protein [Patescibacteria group bacterium]
MNKQKITQENKEDWWLFCDNYLKIASLACKEMLHQKHSVFWTESRGDVGPPAYWTYNLYIPAIYNLKHAIEIFLKYFLIIIEDKFPEIGKDGHHIEKYLNLFSSKYKIKLINKVIKKVIDQAKEQNVFRYTLEAADIEIEFSEEWMKNIAKISLKYFNCEDIKNKITDFNLKDISNDSFRYPKNKLIIELNYSSLVHKITKDDVKKVLKDIGELENAFNSLRFILDVYNDINIK